MLLVEGLPAKGCRRAALHIGVVCERALQLWGLLCCRAPQGCFACAVAAAGCSPLSGLWAQAQVAAAAAWMRECCLACICCRAALDLGS